MFVHPFFSALPSGVLDMTADFTPLFVGLIVTLGLCVLGLVAAIGRQDTGRTEKKMPAQAARAPQLPKAA
ncbi:MAG: hypothetical protein HY268_11160 [Deltaproteobacteria bacterium]|nr:hypothetical protein [Deltaproteobacteria bacterium]